MMGSPFFAMLLALALCFANVSSPFLQFPHPCLLSPVFRSVHSQLISSIVPVQGPCQGGDTAGGHPWPNC